MTPAYRIDDQGQLHRRDEPRTLWQQLMEDDPRGWGVMHILKWLIPLGTLAITAGMVWYYGP